MKQFKQIGPRTFVVRSAGEDPTQKQAITFAEFHWDESSGEPQRVPVTKGIDAADLLALALHVLESDVQNTPAPVVDQESVRQALLNTKGEAIEEVEEDEDAAKEEPEEEPVVKKKEKKASE